MLRTLSCCWPGRAELKLKRSAYLCSPASFGTDVLPSGLESLLVAQIRLNMGDETEPAPGSLSELLCALHIGDTDKAVALVAAKADVCVKDNKGRTPLMLAASQGPAKPLTALVLCKKKKGLTKTSFWFHDSLYITTKCNFPFCTGCQALVTSLLERGAPWNDLDAKVQLFQNLHWCVQYHTTVSFVLGMWYRAGVLATMQKKEDIWKSMRIS